MGCRVKEIQSTNGSVRPARSGRGHVKTNQLQKNGLFASHAGAAEGGPRGRDVSLCCFFMRISSFSKNVFPKDMFRVKIIVLFVFAAI